MILRPEPIYKALQSVHGDEFAPKSSRVVVLTPKGKKWTQNLAKEFAQLEEITFICGRYEGIDQRIEDTFATDVISIGDYVLSGGELPTLVMMETILRLMPGVLEKEIATQEESFSDVALMQKEFPQYTRPEEFLGQKVPEVLLSGNHEEIKKWKNLQMKKLQEQPQNQ
jgi:tRNA (guanine37-N1)-methyltransferase